MDLDFIGWRDFILNGGTFASRESERPNLGIPGKATEEHREDLGRENELSE